MLVGGGAGEDLMAVLFYCPHLVPRSCPENTHDFML